MIAANSPGKSAQLEVEAVRSPNAPRLAADDNESSVPRSTSTEVHPLRPDLQIP